VAWWTTTGADDGDPVEPCQRTGVGHLPQVLPTAVRLALGNPRAVFLSGVTSAATLAVPDLLRQVPVRRDTHLSHQMLVRAVGFTTSAAVQIALIGRLAPLTGLPGGSRHSLPLLRQALTHDARRLTVGVIGYGLLGAVITIPISLKLFGVRLVTGPLPRPTARRLIAAEASNALATSISAPLFALHVAACAATPRTTPTRAPHRPRSHRRTLTTSRNNSGSA